jgi:hypothetical protein
LSSKYLEGVFAMAKTNDKNLSRRSRANGQGSIYYIESRKCYGASIKDYLGKRVTKNFRTKDEAHAWILELVIQPRSKRLSMAFPMLKTLILISLKLAAAVLPAGIQCINV